MTKLRKTMMTLVFALAVVLGTTAGTGNAKAATTKNFKGNLNVTYNNSEWKSKITVKKVNITTRTKTMILLRLLKTDIFNSRILEYILISYV